MNRQFLQKDTHITRPLNRTPIIANTKPEAGGTNPTATSSTPPPSPANTATTNSTQPKPTPAPKLNWAQSKPVHTKTSRSTRNSAEAGPKSQVQIVPTTSSLEQKTAYNQLAVPSVNIFYIHAPIYNHPLEGIPSGVDAAHKAGLFKRFGLSNFPLPLRAYKRSTLFAARRPFPFPICIPRGTTPLWHESKKTELIPLLRKLKSD
ncbi:hypothetical protein G6011_06895 [Alternaria panax]|uniref:Uncharacterized protein n=1 Tax=Alternaria panax TaxID=48097 RepID=A0AAD4I7H2_9PLEO|nr:hypothetical protein G6011_06895 [Alternaria panax]